MEKNRRFENTMDFLRDAFPLKFQFVVIGILHGLIMEIVMLYPNNLPPFSGLVSIIWPRFIPGYRRNYWCHYSGWTSVGLLVGAIPYDFLFERTTFISSSFLVMLSLALMAVHLYKAYLRRRELETEDLIADAEEEEKEVEKPPMSSQKKAVIIVSLSLAAVLLLGYVIKPHVVRFPKDASVSWCKTVGDETVHHLPAEDAAEVVEILNSYGGWEFTTCSWFTLKAVTIGEMTVYLDDSCTHCHYDGNGRRMCLDLKEKDTAALKEIFQQS